MNKLTEKFGLEFAEDINSIGKEKRKGHFHEDLVHSRDVNGFNSTKIPLDMQQAREVHRAAAFDRSRHTEQYTVSKESAHFDVENNTTKEIFQKVSGKKYAFYKNNSSISQVLDINPKSVRPIENDW